MTLRELAEFRWWRGEYRRVQHESMRGDPAWHLHNTSDFGNILRMLQTSPFCRAGRKRQETFDARTKDSCLISGIAHRVGMGIQFTRQVREGQYKYVTTGDKQAAIALATCGSCSALPRGHHQ